MLELIISKTIGTDCRALLNKMIDDVASLELVDYELVNPEQERDEFLLGRLCNQSANMRTLLHVLAKTKRYFEKNNNEVFDVELVILQLDILITLKYQNI